VSGRKKAENLTGLTFPFDHRPISAYIDILMRTGILHRWQGNGGYGEVLRIAFPLILSTGSLTIQHFVDRVFLTWLSPEAIAAATPAGVLNYTIMSLFIGTATYVNTFVAQYWGAGQIKRIGPAMWQGLYFSLLAGLVILPLYPVAEKIFAAAGHDPAVQKLEVQYFRILLFAGFPVTASSALAGFFSGRGKTYVIMWVTFAVTLVNGVLDYGLIFGRLGLPALGIRGAALATLIAQYLRLLIYLFLILRRRDMDRFGVRTGWCPDRALFMRLLRFGLPSGLHYFLEMIGFTLFILMAGRLGTLQLAATNITLNINHLAFMPMVGLGMGLSILVGNRLGENRPELARKSAWSCFHITFVYMSLLAAGYAFLPRLFIIPYTVQADPEVFAPMALLATRLLKFVAVYSLFDAMNLIFASALKGAGDTRFVMAVSVVLNWSFMVIPSYLLITVFNRGLYAIWTCATLYISLLGIAFLLRFLQGKWQDMRVIETPPPDADGHLTTLRSPVQPLICRRSGKKP
jgi:MATE family multidrug resistance protein